MPYYIYEYTLSEKGLLNIKDIPTVINQHYKGVEAIGGKKVETYYVFGEKSFVSIVEFPDDETAEIWNLGSPEDPTNALWEPGFTVKKAFTLEEFTNIVKKLT